MGRQNRFLRHVRLFELRHLGPRVTSVKHTGTGEVGLGTKFELIANFNSRQLPLTYEVTPFDPSRRFVLRAETPMVLSFDEVTFTSTAQGTDVTYNVDLCTRGWLRLTAPVVAVMFNGAGDKARAGLQIELNV